MAESETWKRIGIAASVVGAVGAIVYLLRKPAIGGPVQAGATYIGIPGLVGPPGLVAASQSPAMAGAPGAPPPATVSDITPSGQSLNQYFVSQFYTPDSAVPYQTYAINSNVQPAFDLEKKVSGYESGTAFPANGNGKKNGGCGCSGGCGGIAGRGCGGGRCPNTPGPLIYPDGGGACASTTVGRLQSSMDKCTGGNIPTNVRNLIGNMQYFDAEPDFDLFKGTFEKVLSAAPVLGHIAKGDMAVNNVPASRFGAS